MATGTPADGNNAGVAERYRLVRRVATTTSSTLFLAHDRETDDRVAILAIAAPSDRAGASAAHGAVFADRHPLRLGTLARWLDFLDHAQLRHSETARNARGIIDPAARRGSTRTRAAAPEAADTAPLELDPLAACALVLEWPPGEPVQEAGKALAGEELAGVSVALAHLVDELHARDQAILLHPSLLRWRAEGDLRRLVVIETDPSPVHPAQLEGLRADRRAFLAPELRSGVRADRRVDLYALGATLFVLATGSPPPESPAMRRGQARLALPAGLGPLADVLGRLLVADPAERCAHAAEVIERLGARPARRATPRGDALFAAPIIGRDGELAMLADALAAPGPGVVCVRGPAGAGKTALIERALGRAEGRRVERAAFSWAPQRFDQAYAALARAFQVPEPASGAASPPRSNTSHRVRAFDRLGRSIGAAAARAKGLIVALEDLHLAGDWGAQLVEHLVRQAAEAGHPVHFVCAVEEEWPSPIEGLVEALADEGLAQVIELQGVAADALATVVGGWLGVETPPVRLAAALGRVSGGLPRAAHEILADAVEAGRIYRDGARWVVDATDPALVPLARDDAAAMAARWARLREGDRVVLAELAFGGEPTVAVALAATLSRGDAEVASILARLERGGWLLRSLSAAGFAYVIASATRGMDFSELPNTDVTTDAAQSTEESVAVPASGPSLGARMRLLGHPAWPDSLHLGGASAENALPESRDHVRAALAAGQLDAALEAAAAAAKRAVDAEDYQEIALAGLDAGEVLRAMGDLDGALAHADHARSLGARWRDGLVYAGAKALSARIQADKGAYLPAVVELEQAVATLEPLGRGAVDLVAARRAECRAHLELAEVLVFADARGRASRSLERARALRGSEVAPPTDTALEALVDAELARGRGDLARARAILDGARSAAGLAPAAELSWRMALAAARVLREAGQPDAAEAAHAAALAAIEANARALGPERGERYRSTGRRLDRGIAAEVVATTPSAREAPRAGTGREAAGYGTLLEINKELALEHDLEPLLARIMDTAIELLGAERGVLLLGGDEPGGVAVARDYQRRTIDHAAAQISRSIVARVIATGQPLLSTNASEDDRLDAYQSVGELRLRSVLCVPLEAGGKRLGALYLDNRFEQGIFGASHKELLGAFAGQAALAIARARLLDENRRRAAEIVSLNQQLAQEVRAQGDELVAIKAELEGARGLKHEYGEIVGRSEAMRRVLGRIDRATEHTLPVYIHGESGTGKELVARAIHANGPRRGARFVVENCAAVAESLLEGELFGYVRGAFTGATEDRAGLFEHADGGTIFLDEVGDMSPGMQKSLLRVLQEGEVRRVGGKAPIKVDARVISASNRDLAKLVVTGEFREDLYYRLDVLRIDLPPLRDRRDDVAELVEHVLEEWSRTHGAPRRRVSAEALELLAAHDWPGNVRELRNAVMGALSLTDAEILGVRDFALKLPLARRTTLTGAGEPPMLSLDDYTRWFVERFQGELNDTELAKKLGISRKTLWEKRKRFGIAKG